MFDYATLDHAALKQARLRTNLKTVAIFSGMLFILWLCASLVVGDEAVLIAAAGGVLLFLMSATPSASLIMRLARAVPISPHDAPDLYSDLAELSRRAGLNACPRLWWLGTSGINAFAAGGGDGAGIAVSDGAFRTLSRHELVGVLAHEVAHIAAGDTRLMTIGIVVLRVTQIFAVLGLLLSFILVVLTVDPDFAPIGLTLTLAMATPAVAVLHLALSRNLEFAADLRAARLTGDAVGLARALERIDMYQRERGVSHKWLRTHPPTAERVERLLGNVRLVARRPQPAVIYI